MPRIFLFALLLLVGLQRSYAQTFPVIKDQQTSRIQEEALERSSLGAADTSQARVISPLSLDLIKDFEKWVPFAYNDASMFCTIGYGHLITRKACEMSSEELSQLKRPMSVPTGLTLLDSDTGLARLAVMNLVKVDLNDEQFGALVSFVFNVGAANFEHSTMMRLLRNGELDRVAGQFPRWIRSNGVVLDGLINRRSCEAALFRGTFFGKSNGSFHREDCASLGAAPATEDLVDIGDGETQR